MNFREQYGLALKASPRCPDCGVEHRGRCFFLRSQNYRSKVTPEQMEQYRRNFAVRKLIKRLGEFVDEARHTD